MWSTSAVSSPALARPSQDPRSSRPTARARATSPTTEHHDRMKHVERRHYFIRDMVESLKIEVPLVRTTDNWSDFFTKAFDAKKFHAMRRVIMNDPERP